MRALLVSLAVAIAAASLGGTASGSAPLERHAVRGQGMSLAVPPSWVAVDGSLPPAAIERFARENPALARYIRQLSGPSSPMKFLALDPQVRAGFATNVNVVLAPAPSVPFATYRQALLAEIGSIVGSAKIDDRVVTIHGVRGVRLSYRLRLQVGRSFTVQTLQYAFLRAGRSVVVTYTTLPSLESQYAGTFARSAASIRFA